MHYSPSIPTSLSYFVYSHDDESYSRNLLVRTKAKGDEEAGISDTHLKNSTFLLYTNLYPIYWNVMETHKSFSNHNNKSSNSWPVTISHGCFKTCSRTSANVRMFLRWGKNSPSVPFCFSVLSSFQSIMFPLVLQGLGSNAIHLQNYRLLLRFL